MRGPATIRGTPRNDGTGTEGPALMIVDGIRHERCAVCGATISAPDDDWAAIAASVLLHGRSARHRTDPEVAATRAAYRRAVRAHLKAEVEEVRAMRAVS